MATPADPHSSPAPSDHGDGPAVNVGQSERWASVATGGLMALYGLSKKSPGGLLIAGAGAALAYRGTTGHCSVYKALGVSTADADENGHVPSQKLGRHGVHVEVAYTIERPRHELFAFFRDFTNLPKFMRHLQDVKILDGKRSRWTVEGPAGTTLTWEADVINEVPDSLIAWHSLAGGGVDSAGSVRFLDGPPGRGTEVKVSMDYVPPLGKVGAVVAKLFGKSGEAEVREDLRRFKRLMETGEIATIEGQSHGSRSTLGRAVTGGN